MISFFDKFKGRGPLNHSLASRSDSNYEGESKSVLCKPRKHTGGGVQTLRHSLHSLLHEEGGPGNSVGIATDYGLDGPGSNAGGN